MAENSEKGHFSPAPRVFSCLPTSLVPYAELIRIHRPLGYYLNISPYFVGVAYCASITPTKLPAAILLNRVLILSLWAFCLRSGGCAWDDIIDLDLDCQVTRTKSRPLPRGAVSTKNAVLFTAAIFACGCSLLFALPRLCVFDAVVILFWALLYPFGKRFTNYPQMVLVNIGWAIPMSMHSLGLDPLAYAQPTFCMFSFIATVIIMIDVLYSRQDTEEDIKAGVKSMAVRFRHSIDFLAYFLLCASTVLLIGAGVFAQLGLSFFILSVGGHVFGFLALLRATRYGKSSDVESIAKSSCFIASICWVLGLVVEYVLRN